MNRKLRLTISQICWLLAIVTVIQIGYVNCSGSFKSKSSESSSSSSTQIGGALASGGWTCNTTQTGLGENRSRRLTTPEVLLSLRRIFGDDILSNSSVTTAILALPQEPAFGQFNVFDNRIQSVEALMDVSEAIATALLANSTAVTRVLNCNADTNATVCQTNVLDKLGLQIFRRPLTDAERTSFTSFMQGIGGKEGVKWGIARLINSPQFIQLLEIDDTQLQASRAKLSQYELASRIAFRVTGATPDLTLLNAAGAGQLASLDQVKTQVARLMNTPDAQARMKDMIRNWLNLQSVGDPYPGVAAGLGIQPAGLGAEELNEFNLFLDQVIFTNGGNFNSLMTDKTAFANTSRLAKLYNLPQSNLAQNFQDARGGILLRAATLTSAKPWTDPIGRGVYFRRRILCGNLSSPPSDIIALRQMQLGTVSHVTTGNRDIVTNLTQPITCMGCHSQINPLGFTLEKFGALGELRTAESIYDDAGQLLAQHPINTQVDNLALDANKSIAASGPEDLIAAVVQSEAGRACFTTQLFAQARYRFPASADGCTLNDIRTNVIKGQSIKQTMIDSIATEELFWRGL